MRTGRHLNFSSGRYPTCRKLGDRPPLTLQYAQDTRCVVPFQCQATYPHDLVTLHLPRPVS